MVNGVSLLDDQSSSLLFTMGKANLANRPFSTQGFANDFQVVSGVPSGRNSTLEPVEMSKVGKRGR